MTIFVDYFSLTRSFLSAAVNAPSAEAADNRVAAPSLRLAASPKADQKRLSAALPHASKGFYMSQYYNSLNICKIYQIKFYI